MIILGTEQVHNITSDNYYCILLMVFLAGDARNEVLTTSELAKMKFDPNYYRVNAYQGLAYDPMRKKHFAPYFIMLYTDTSYIGHYNNGYLHIIRAGSCWIGL